MRSRPAQRPQTQGDALPRPQTQGDALPRPQTQGDALGYGEVALWAREELLFRGLTFR